MAQAVNEGYKWCCIKTYTGGGGFGDTVGVMCWVRSWDDGTSTALTLDKRFFFTIITLEINDKNTLSQNATKRPSSLTLPPLSLSLTHTHKTDFIHLSIHSNFLVIIIIYPASCGRFLSILGLGEAFVGWVMGPPDCWLIDTAPKDVGKVTFTGWLTAAACMIGVATVVTVGAGVRYIKKTCDSKTVK